MKRWIVSILALVGLTAAAQAELANIPSNFDITTTYSTGNTPPDPYAVINDNDEAAFRFDCEWSHVNYDDPIIFPNHLGISHLHMFFGNTLANYASDYSSLRQTGEGTCAGGKANRTGYWFPAVFDALGRVRIPDSITVYYKTTRKAQPGGSVGNQVYTPRGLRYIFGYNFADTGATRIHFFGCVSGTASVGTFAELATCASNQQAFVRIDAGPKCWDGINLDSTNHRSHMAFLDGGGACPGTHPHRIPSVTIIAWFSHDGAADVQGWYLSSDRFNGATLPGGTSFHSDWFGAWDYSIQQMWENNCLGMLGAAFPDSIKDTCNNVLGQGWNLRFNATPSGIDLTPLTGTNRYMDAPDPTKPGMARLR